MAKIISIPPPAAQAGGLSNSLVAGLVGDRVVDPFLVADNNNITGQFLRDLIGSAFDAHRTLQTMNAVVASATAMNAVVASATAMNAVAASATAVEAIRVNATANNIALGSSFSVGAYLDRIRIIGGAATDATLAAHSTMSAVAASATAMNAVAASATAMSAVAASSTAMNAVAASATAVETIFNSSVARIAVYDSTVAWDALRVNVTAQTHMFNIDLSHNASWEGGAPWTHPPSVVSTTRVVVTQFRTITEGHLAQSRNFAQTVFFDTSSATFQHIFLRMAGVQHRSATDSTNMRYIIMQ